MKKFNLEMTVGLFMAIGLLAIAYLTLNVGGIELFGGNYYKLYANFDSVGGLKTGAQVEIAGVPVGKVSNITLKDDQARVELSLRPDVKVGSDVFASIKTQGIIGDKYVLLTPGADDDYLKDGDEITDTESAVDLESLISKYVFGNVDKK
ncbi:MAG: outer membrane lipid asymmetry maintenance protein MlaD [Deltaproteobacteria bacterium]|nr:outer membrane lipid asymmetry maintenance protein MlaD [Deltaproteobacteria bacterium]